METIDKVMMCGGAAFALLASPFVAAHVAESWDAPEYPYTGFCPDCPVHYENTLPPVQESAAVCDSGVTKGGAR